MLTEQQLYEKRVYAKWRREQRRHPMGYHKLTAKAHGMYAEKVHEYRKQQMHRIATMPKQQQGLFARMKSFFRRTAV